MAFAASALSAASARRASNSAECLVDESASAIGGPASTEPDIESATAIANRCLSDERLGKECLDISSLLLSIESRVGSRIQKRDRNRLVPVCSLAARVCEA